MIKYRWGIVGTGMISHLMADALSVLDNAEVTAVLSRTNESAEKFASEYGIKSTYTDLEDFAGSSYFDIAYIGTPHNNHKNETIECLNSGKAVLCEKPMGVNANEVEAMVNASQNNKVMLMEAFWTYYFPAMQTAFELIKQGVIGKPLMVDARFCFYKEFDVLHRAFNPDLAGGALLDIGLYCISFAQKVFNEFPCEIKGVPALGKTGTDDTSVYVLKYSENRMAVLTSSFKVNTTNEAWIFGEKGSIKIPRFWQPDEIILNCNGKEKKYNFKRLGNGYTYEAIKMMEYLDNGRIESDVFSHKDTRDLISIMDKLRSDWNLKYPFE